MNIQNIEIDTVNRDIMISFSEYDILFDAKQNGPLLEKIDFYSESELISRDTSQTILIREIDLASESI